MAAGARITVTTTKHTYVLNDSVDALTTIDASKGTGFGTPRYQVLVDGSMTRTGSIHVQGPGNPAGFVSFTRALKAFHETIRWYERH